MKMPRLTKEGLDYRRDQFAMRKDGWEFVGEDGGRLWELYRGCRMAHRIVDVRIAAGGKGLWIKTEAKA